MDIDASPPKRVTRARAAAKSKTVVDTGIKVATAAAKAKATRTMPPTLTKRKTRADEIANEENNETAEEIVAAEPEKPRVTRGRPRKAAIVQPEPEMEEATEKIVVQPKTKGRPKRVVDETRSIAPTPALEVPRTRGRARKVEVAQEQTPLVSEPPKRIVRGRQATVTKPTAPPKKSVKFEDAQELDKENVIPTTSKGKAKETEVASGMRAKPVRKPAAATRVTRGRAKTTTTEPEPPKAKSPLSPKKATQVATAKDAGSDDELATMEKTPMKPLVNSPFKAPGSVLNAAKKLDFITSITVNRASTTTQDLGSSIMASPARRIPQSPWRGALNESPKRIVLADSVMQSPFKASMPPPASTSTFKASLLQSPARRPPSPTKVSAAGSPTKVSAAGSPTRSTSSSRMFGATPKPSTFSVSRFTTPRTLTKSAFRPGKIPFSNIGQPATESRAHDKDQRITTGTMIKPFPGRLSAVLPRYANPTMREENELQAVSATPEAPLDEDEGGQYVLDTMAHESTGIDHADEALAVVDEESRSTTPTNSPPIFSSRGSFGLSREQEDPFQDSDSEDELASASPLYIPTPLSAFKMSSEDFAELSTPKKLSFGNKTPATNKVMQFGFTPLARQLGGWMAPVQAEPEDADEELLGDVLVPTLMPHVEDQVVEQVVEQSPVKSSFFEDEMIVRDEAELEHEVDADETVLEALEFAPVELDEEDLALAAEADEMSLIEMPEEDEEDIVDILDYAVDDDRALSEASQEYGDENSVPIDPALLALDGESRAVEESHESHTETMGQHIPETEAPAEIEQVTPLAPRSIRRPAQPFTPARRSAERTFHTISKVPLKPAGADSPLKPSPRKRPASASRVTAQRAALPPPAITSSEQASTPFKATPNNWSNFATPTRTPRRDLDDKVLRGAVVYVDVHTSEGADASALFVELLGQMGAKCVKTWAWNPNATNLGSTVSPDAAESSKIGITHVVYKDGGKRTLEKVRESKGVVLCVGVGWVLEYVS